jgi:UDP-glucose 4-epimerase
MLLLVMDSSADVELAPARKVNPVERRLADVSAAARDLGFTARIELDEGLRRLVEWTRAEREQVSAPDG